MKRTIKLPFFGGKIHGVEFKVERFHDEYILNATVDTGYELGNCHDGIFNYLVDRNTRLRSKKSIQAEQERLMEDLIEMVTEHSESTLVDKMEVKAKISGTECFVQDGIRGVPFFSACNIRSAESGHCIAWHPHDVFKDGEITLVAERDGEFIRFSAPDILLYDRVKLKALTEKPAFKEERYAFFSYSEVRRILGDTNAEYSMSGLFSQRGK